MGTGQTPPWVRSMAELGEFGNPRDLIPGDPDAVERNVTAIRGRGQSMEIAGGDLKKIDSGAWEGAAGGAFRDKFTYEPARWHRAADAFECTVKALESYASTLRWAQSEAREAIHLWDEGQETTRAATAKHDHSVAEAEAQNRANAAAGDPAVVQVAPFSDPGEAKRQAAREMLNRARQQLTEAGDRAAGSIRARGDEAPETSGWSDVGDFFSGAGDFIGDFAVGAWDAVSGTAEFLWDISPHHLITDIEAYGETWKELGNTVAAAVDNPVEFGKQLIGWEHWKNGEPGRALGQIAGGAVLGYGAGKVASTLTKLRKAGKAKLQRIEDVKNRISDPKGFSPDSVKGMSRDDLEKAIPPDWVRGESRSGGGVVFRDPNNPGRQVRLMPGYTGGNRPDALAHGPYAVISQNGRTVKIPLEGNPTLGGP